MTEDEAFIRTIVDSPGDDLPRLVYADWLDERNDPRGAYLRAELEWAKPWREGRRPGPLSTLHQLAVGIDPVWVARVSRPPVGVCFETPLFRRLETPPASDEAINAVGVRFGVVFPPEYRAFLRNYNGGWLSTPGEEYFPEGDDTLFDIACVEESADVIYARGDESNRRCGLFPVGGTAGASGHITLLGVGLDDGELGKLHRGVFAACGEGPWTANGEFIEVENWDHKVADSLPEWFAVWEEEALERVEWK